ncbi:MAG: multiheme c-type cytochrome [Gemmataceae bacterium]
MVTDYREPTAPSSQPQGGAASQTLRPPRPLPLIVAASVLALGGWTLTYCLHTPPAPAAGRTSAHVPPATELYRGWPEGQKPALALVLSGQEYGYLHPCGCSRPQLGGLERRYNFIQSLKDKGWPVVAVDLGDVPQRKGPLNLPNVQGMLKYSYAMKARDLMGYSAVGVGEYEIGMQLTRILGNYALNFPTPRVLAANIRDRDILFPEMLWSTTTAGGGNGAPKVGVIGLVGPSVAKHVNDPDVAFQANTIVLPQALQELQANKPEFLVLLYQGSLAEAKACAERFPQLNVILCLSQDNEEEPSDKPETVGDTLIVKVGHKGRYVGVVGAFRTGNPARPFQLHYQLVPITEDYETPIGAEENNPVLALLEEYAQELKTQDYLSKYPQRKHVIQLQYPQARYVGSRKCRGCHPSAYEVWENSDHAHAYQTLVDATRPSLRQFDAECIVCHVVGFGHETGFRNAEDTPLLKNVGCENCHGPGSEHVRRPRDTQLHALMNPFKPNPHATAEEEQKRLLLLDQSCQQCHDIDNDVHWNFEKKWPKIIHRTPPEEKE